MVEIVGAIPRQYLLEIRLQCTFALTYLLGPSLLGRLPIFGSDLVGVDQRLRAGRSRCQECDGGDENDQFQMSLRKKAHASARSGRAQTANAARAADVPNPQRSSVTSITACW